MEPIRLWQSYGYRPFQDEWVFTEPTHTGPEDACEYAALPRAEYDALVAERDALRGRVEETKEPRVLMDVYRTGRRAECEMEDVVFHFDVCDNWWFDTYDSSVEMTSVRDGWLPDEDQRKALANVGIRLAYLSYRDGTAVLVDTVTGASGGCSPRNTAENQSALVVSLSRERDAATARVDTASAKLAQAEALLREARGCVAVNYGPNEGTRLLARIDALLDTPTEADRRGEDGAWCQGGERG